MYYGDIKFFYRFRHRPKIYMYDITCRLSLQYTYIDIWENIIVSSNYSQVNQIMTVIIIIIKQTFNIIIIIIIIKHIIIVVSLINSLKEQTNHSNKIGINNTKMRKEEISNKEMDIA